jgi:hypothetical protein
MSDDVSLSFGKKKQRETEAGSNVVRFCPIFIEK